MLRIQRVVTENGFNDGPLCLLKDSACEGDIFGVFCALDTCLKRLHQHDESVGEAKAVFNIPDAVKNVRIQLNSLQSLSSFEEIAFVYRACLKYAKLNKFTLIKYGK